MKNNKLYMPADAIARHEDFEVWYPDGDLALSVKAPWEKESDKVLLFGRLGGETGHIRPDHDTLSYDIRIERYTYELHTIRVFQKYKVVGMLWNINGSVSDPPFDFLHEETDDKDGHVRITDFLDKGPCFEVKVKDIPNLRVAAAVVIGMAIKEEYKGKSEGEQDPTRNALQKTKDFFFPSHGIEYEDLIKQEQQA